ncbi:MAG: glutamine synthetase family protein [Notoacmeibacter sp.]|nr:glutamine synthetase family protein [Notoacmeibacter sp.]
MGERLRLLFCDHLNLARGKYLPASKIGDGASRFCQSTFAVTYDKDLIPSPGSMMLDGLPDMEARYVASEIRDGWEPETKIVVSDLYGADGNPLAMCGRGALKRAVADWGRMGLTPKVGLELEAYAFRRDDTGRLVPYDTPGAYVYSTGRLADPDGFMDAIWFSAEEMGFSLEVMTSEYDSPQFEFTLTYDDAVRAVDDAFLFRLMAREIALDHGIVLTFMPKPILEKGGNGLHVNFSFTDKAGNNALANGETGGPHNLNDLARGCIAGLMKHHASMAALVAPTVNSYRRLQPATLSGYWCNWGGDHRGVTTRISSEGGKKARIEHRMGDGSANPYTHVAAVLQAARLGVANGYELPPMETGDCFESQDASEGVPENLGAALDALEADAALADAVGRGLCDNLVFMKRDEIGKTAELEGEALRDFYIHYL